MDFQENPAGQKIEDILSENPEPFEHVQNENVNENDFSVDNFGPAEEEKKDEKKEEKKEEKKTEEKKDEKKDEKSEEEKKEEKKTEEKKNEVVARLMKPDTLIAFGDILLVRIGGLLTPDKPREYWALTAQDKKDLSFLLMETIKEENWSHIPTKYMLLFTVVLILGGKALNMNKPYKGAGANDQEKKNPDAENEKIMQEEKKKEKENKNEGVSREEFNEVKRQNDLLQKQIRDLINDKKEKHYTDFEEVKENNNPVERMYKPPGSKINYDLEEIEFTLKGAIIDETKAGKQGYTSLGAKLGIPSREHTLVFEQWKRYRAFIKKNRLRKAA